MKSGIPISGREPIESPSINGVVYLVRPAIGAIEEKVQATQSSIYDTKTFFPIAAKRVDEENKGREWKPGERIEKIHSVARDIAEEKFWAEYSTANANKRRDEIFDIICAGWKGEGCYVLKDGEKASEHVPGAPKQRVVDWYMETQMQLSGEEVKNS